MYTKWKKKCQKYCNLPALCHMGRAWFGIWHLDRTATLEPSLTTMFWEEHCHWPPKSCKRVGREQLTVTRWQADKESFSIRARNEATSFCAWKQERLAVIFVLTEPRVEEKQRAKMRNSNPYALNTCSCSIPSLFRIHSKHAPTLLAVGFIVQITGILAATLPSTRATLNASTVTSKSTLMFDLFTNEVYRTHTLKDL